MTVEPDAFTPAQQQMALELLSTRTTELLLVIDSWCETHPNCVEPLAVEEADPDDSNELERSAGDSRPFFFLDETPMPPLGADVWIFGDPPQVRANGRAFPRLKVVTSDADAAHAARWLVRVLRRRARTYEALVRAAFERRPQLATVEDPATVEPVPIRELAEAAQLTEDAVSRIAAACRFQNVHGLMTFNEVSGSLQFRRE
ncbi:MAG: hypothetical protein H0X17_04760 [Deltaproteobacteria bacterium]|nr:hypothetical protein [Deltaproteobacteria bacterium]